jgi:hypothetical protein
MMRESAHMAVAIAIAIAIAIVDKVLVGTKLTNGNQPSPKNEGPRGPSAAQDRTPPPGTRHFLAADDMKVVGLEMRRSERELQVE